ncbi:MAG: hypothetical protein EXR62_00045 [Chloroflexi bacterium]|nr:hypothetical protein [Chloroflexota bacterium]
MRRFYGEVLGLIEIMHHNQTSIFAAGDRPFLIIEESREVYETNREPQRLVLNLFAESPRATFNAIVRRGAKVVQPVRVLEDGNRRWEGGTVADPDGNLVQIVHHNFFA